MSEERQIDYDSVGTSEAHVAVAPSELSIGLDEALDLQPISIRLQRDLIDNLKALARLNGLGYQPLIRQVLTRWVDCELKSMLQNKLVNESAKQGETSVERESDSALSRKAA